MFKKLLSLFAVAALAMNATAAYAADEEEGSWWLVGSFNSWKLEEAAGAKKLEKQADGTYKIEMAELITGFKFIGSANQNNPTNWNTQLCAVKGEKCVFGEEMPLETDDSKGDNIDFANCTKAFDVVIVLDAEAQVCTVTGRADTALPDLWMTGSFCSWATPGEGNSIAFTENDGVYTATATFNGAFSFKVCGAGWSNEMGASEKNALYFDDSDNKLSATLDGNQDCDANLTGEYDITFVLDTRLLTFTAKSSGIAEVAATNAPAVYYNLQGVRVANPAAGTIVICLQDGKATKLLVK